MDWRKRDYFLIHTSWRSYDMRHMFYKIAAPSMKSHKPFNHFKLDSQNIEWFKNYDGNHLRALGLYFPFPQEMISCKKEESEALEYELRKAYRNDGHESNYIKLTKELIPQKIPINTAVPIRLKYK